MQDPGTGHRSGPVDLSESLSLFYEKDGTAGMHSRRHRLVSSRRSLLLPDHPNAETLKSARQLKVDALLDVHNRASAMPSALRQGLMP